MKRKILLSISLVLSICLIMTSLVGCISYRSSKAMEIAFEDIDKEILAMKHLDVKAENKLTLVEDGTTNASIYIDSTSNALTRSASDLQSVIKDMTGAELPLKNIADGGKGIYLGNTTEIDITNVKNDGFVIDVNADRVAIRGKDDHGTMNGVYTFLEEYLGAIFLDPYTTYTTHHDNIYIEKGNKVINPVTPWRDVYGYETTENYWAGKLRLNAIDVETKDEDFEIEEEHQKTPEAKRRRLNELRQYNEWGTWCHSFYTFLSPEEYFDTHPEYFSLFKGERIHKLGDRDAHLCLSNPEVYNIVERKLFEMIDANPDIKYWDFSVNDTSAVPGCQCDNCKALDKAAGGTGMGSLMPFINKLARRVKEVYPDKEIYISTLAYFHTINPPKNMKAEDNVVIKLCSMPGDQGTSYLEPGSYNAAVFNRQLEAWSEVADHIVVWDYVVNFTHLLAPFPNFAVQSANQKFYENNNIQGVFHQASREKGGEMASLRDYILAKLMWQGSTMDVAHEVSKYIAAYYGDASSDIIKYMNDVHRELSRGASNLGLYDGTYNHYNDYLSERNVRSYEESINAAKTKVADDSVLLGRVEQVELGVMYAKSLLPRIDNEEREQARARVNEICDKYNIDMVCEWQSLDEFNDTFDEQVRSIKGHVNKPIFASVGIFLAIIVVGIVSFIVVFEIKKKRARRVHDDMNKPLNSDNNSAE